MEETKEKANLHPDDTSSNEINQNNDADIQQKLNDNDNDKSSSSPPNENEQIYSYRNECVNKAIAAFKKNEENSLFDLASSLVSAITIENKEKTEEESQDKNTEFDENNKKEDINETSETTETTETEVDGEFEFEFEMKNDNDNDNNNEVTLVNVLTETDPISPNYEDDQNSYKEPTFQTGLDNPNITKRPGSSQVLKRTFSSNGNRTRIVIKSNNNGRRNGQRPSTASGIRSNKESIPSEEVLQNALDLMLHKKILPDAEIRPEVINYAKKLISKKMLEESYDEASEIDIAIDIMFTSIEDDRIKADEIVKKNDLQTRMDRTINKILLGH